VSGGVTPGGEAAALIERHLHFHQAEYWVRSRVSPPA
jgi:hypothetical protein